MKERPIILQAHEVRGILDDRQTQLRRIAKFKQSSATTPFERGTSTDNYRDGYVVQGRIGSCWNDLTEPLPCPFGKVGDRLWGREAFGLMSYDQGDDCKTDVIYREDAWFLESDGKKRTDEPIGNWDLDGGRWRPANHMPRWAIRILLEIVNVRVERLQSASDVDLAKHNFDVRYANPNGRLGSKYSSAIEEYRYQFSKDHSYDLWASNPWVWVIEFKRVGI